jgi:hypothetical protein
MANTETIDEGRALSLGREVGLGFVYWLVFLLVLEPDNILRIVQAGGSTFTWGEELLRILGACLLGAAATPLVLAMVRRFPIEGARWERNAGIQAAGGAAIAAGLVFISCVLADWMLPSEHRPFLVALGEELVSNWSLLVFCLAGLVAIAHAVRFFREAQDGKRAHEAAVATEERDYLTIVPVKARGRVTLLEIDRVDWIETQGNYLALHVGTASHLIRESLARFEAGLDPARFARIHRRMIVAIDRIAEIAPLGAGDATLRLKNGTELRVSRSFRDRLPNWDNVTVSAIGPSAGQQV